MNPPEHVQIGPHRYTLTTHVWPEDDHQVGECDKHALTIRYDDTQHRSQLADTLLHECLHAITYATGFSNEWGQELDEAFVCRFTPTLLSFLRDNPDLIRFLQKAT